MESKELLHGTLEMMVLKTLSRGPNHGYGIAQHIQSVSADSLKIGEGSLYPALQRLLVNDWVRGGVGSFGEQPQGPHLQTHAGRPQAAGRRAPDVRRHDPRHRPRNGGLNAMRLWNKIRARFGRAVEGDLAEEMRLHRAMLEDRFRQRDSAPARRAAGPPVNSGQIAIALEDSRAEWSFAWLESLVIDVRYAVRALIRDQTFSATAVLTLGVGLALASVAFTLFNAYVLRPFAVADPGALYEVHWLGKDDSVRMHPWRDYEEIRARRDVFADALASRGVFVTGVTRHWSGKLVSGSYFRMLGAHIELGRAIEDRDTQTPLGDNVVVLGLRRLEIGIPARSRRCSASKLVLRGHSYEIIGVASREFAGLDESPPDFWAPISMHAAFRKEEMEVEVIGRLREGVSKAQARSGVRGDGDARPRRTCARNSVRERLPSPSRR